MRCEEKEIHLLCVDHYYECVPLNFTQLLQKMPPSDICKRDFSFIHHHSIKFNIYLSFTCDYSRKWENFSSQIQIRKKTFTRYQKITDKLLLDDYFNNDIAMSINSSWLPLTTQLSLRKIAIFCFSAFITFSYLSLSIALFFFMFFYWDGNYSLPLTFHCSLKLRILIKNRIKSQKSTDRCHLPLILHNSFIISNSHIRSMKSKERERETLKLQSRTMELSCSVYVMTTHNINLNIDRIETYYGTCGGWWI